MPPKVQVKLPSIFRSKSIGGGKMVMEGTSISQGNNIHIGINIPKDFFKNASTLDICIQERNLTKDVKTKTVTANELKNLKMALEKKVKTYTGPVEISDPVVIDEMTYRMKKKVYLNSNPIKDVQVKAEIALKREFNKKFKLPPIGSNPVEAAVNDTLFLEDIGHDGGNSFLGSLNISFPVLGPSKPSTTPTEEDLMGFVLKKCLKLDDKITYENVRDAKKDVALIFKQLTDWHQSDTPSFWKNFRPDDGELLPEVESSTPGSRALYHIGVIAEHQTMAEPFEEFNSKKNPWIWQLPDDRDNLITELSGLYKEKGADAFFNFLAKYKYKEKYRLPRYVACDVAIDAIHDTLDITDEEPK
ncbi:Fc.00g096790.m01.CDS01 [Cosmosporella sp. VM-42]